MASTTSTQDRVAVKLMASLPKTEAENRVAPMALAPRVRPVVTQEAVIRSAVVATDDEVAVANAIAVEIPGINRVALRQEIKYVCALY